MNETISLENLTQNARYSDILDSLLSRLGGIKEVLRINFESDYSGFVDCDVLLNDGKIFSYMYYYGSCSGCDDWERTDLTEEQIMNEMKTEATFFENLQEYLAWRDMVNKKNV